MVWEVVGDRGGLGTWGSRGGGPSLFGGAWRSLLLPGGRVWGGHRLGGLNTDCCERRSGGESLGGAREEMREQDKEREGLRGAQAEEASEGLKS